MGKSEALIIGGTKGLGEELSLEAWRRKLTPVILGRSVLSLSPDSKLNQISRGSFRVGLDLTVGPSIQDALLVVGSNFKNIRHVVWNAGIFSRKSLRDLSAPEMDLLIYTHLRGPMKFLQGFHSSQKFPYHLVVVASTSSWRMRTDEALYCTLKAAKAAFTRNFSRELVRDIPGSRVTLVNPGGLKTPNFWGPSGQDISAFMEPAEVSRIIWDEVLAQKENYHEIQIMRNSDGSPKVEYGPRLPEMPF